MNERQKLLNRVQICGFVLDDVRLYLDFHPCDQAALDYYKKYIEMKEQATKEYTSKFGPLMANDNVYTDKWTWVEEPWPWERGV